MVDTALNPAILKAIQVNELGSASPYCLSFARLGVSGASFGVFQGDTNVNHKARAVLMDVLTTTEADQDTLNRILAALSQPCPNGNPLSDDDTNLVNTALASDAGKSLVNQMDDNLLQVVLGELDTCIAAASTRSQTIEDVVLLYIALWVNMTGQPRTLNAFLSGSTEFGLSPPVGPTVTENNITNYLLANRFFQLHPHNFVHMQQSVQAGEPLLPA